MNGTVSVTWTELGIALGVVTVIIGAFAYYLDKRITDFMNAMDEAIERAKHPVTRP